MFAKVADVVDEVVVVELVVELNVDDFVVVVVVVVVELVVELNVDDFVVV